MGNHANGRDQQRPEIILIAAMAANRVIGRDNTIPWHIPGEQLRFKRITMGHTLIMGRKTHESIGQVLPGRRTIIITRQRDYRAAGCLVVHDLPAALAAAADDSQVFIAGGAEIFRLALPYADAIYLSILHREVAGNILFPSFTSADFPVVFQEVIDEGEPYTFTIYRRKKTNERWPCGSPRPPIGPCGGSLRHWDGSGHS